MSNGFKGNAGKPQGPNTQILNNGFLSNREVLLDSFAQQCGEYLAREGLTRTQIRRFYQDVQSINSRINIPEDFEKNKPLIIMIKAKVAYATGRRDAKVPKYFKDLIDACIKSAKLEFAQFKGFVQFFEALVAYHYPLAKD